MKATLACLTMLLALMVAARAQPSVQPVLQSSTIESVPPGASVYGENYIAANGSGYLGTTPLQLELDARRSHVLYVVREGYGTERCRLEPGQRSLVVDMVPNSPWSWVVHHVRAAPYLALGALLLMLGGAAAVAVHYVHIRRRAAWALEFSRLEAAAPADTVGDYEILERLGEGSDAIVYRARHRTLGDVVALKVLKREGLDDEALARFHREMEIGRDLRHRNLVRVHGFGEMEGLPYLASEFVEGETLQRRLTREGALPAAEMMRIGAEVCSGLQACHEAGIVHRDLKPSNIMLTAAGGVRLLDFGIARRADRRRLTATGAPMGTPMYVAPEQVRGRPDHRADIYSLGVVMFEALSGRPPFDAEDAVAVMMAHCSEKPPRLQDVAPTVPSGLSDLVDRLLEKSAARRFQSAAEVEGALRAMLEPHPTIDAVQRPLQVAAREVEGRTP